MFAVDVLPELNAGCLLNVLLPTRTFTLVLRLWLLAGDSGS